MVGQWPTIVLMDFEWDLAKSNSCQISRNFDFAYVISIFKDPTILIEHDQRWDCGEERYRAIGAIDKRVFVVVFTRRVKAIRIISARKANNREVKRYEENSAS
ncbi:BrnT family toxin [Polynucleobacter sp. MWH-UH35A]|uniref:BrnT family toxin n=1 Tax=Polynucleobacter sp. MWH-UH35A TaxID=1855619 RepID=UPI00352E380A